MPDVQPEKIDSGGVVDNHVKGYEAVLMPIAFRNDLALVKLARSAGG